MQIVIDIPEEMYRTVQDGTYCGSLYEELKTGTPLPKGHGRLGDLDAVMDDINRSIEGITNIGIMVDGEYLWGKLNDAIYNASTIIKADKEERPDNICTQRCCLKNHNIGIIECDEECSNRTLF